MGIPRQKSYGGKPIPTSTVVDSLTYRHFSPLVLGQGGHLGGQNGHQHLVAKSFLKHRVGITTGIFGDFCWDFWEKKSLGFFKIPMS